MGSMLARDGKSWLPGIMAALPLTGSCFTLLLCTPTKLRFMVLRSALFSAGGYLVTRLMMPGISAKMPSDRRGCDLLKRPPREPISIQDKVIPESMGIVSGVTFVVVLVLTQATTTVSDLRLEYSAAMLSIVFAVLLGFVDDFLDLEWKYKYALPPLMSMPLVAAYDGGTRVIPPRFCRNLLILPGKKKTLSSIGHILNKYILEPLFHGTVDLTSGTLDLGLAYKIYMVGLGVFSTNAINILAGVNGLEAGQVYIIACAILIMSAVELHRASHWDSDEQATKNHLLAVTLMLPFATTTLALLKDNWFPAKIFVGDTFTNYAGMTLAVVAILGHFPIMLMLLMLPQLINFILSIPQLFGLWPCPRHRLPTYNPKSGLLHASRLNDRNPTFVPVHLGQRPNLTLINFFLLLFGPMTEPCLATSLLLFQLLCCAFGLALRFLLTGHVY